MSGRRQGSVPVNEGGRKNDRFFDDEFFSVIRELPEDFDRNAFFGPEGYGVSGADRPGGRISSRKIDYYTGYEEHEGEQQYADPFAADPYEQYLESKKKLPRPDESEKTINFDKQKFIVSVIIGAAIILITFLPLINSLAENISDQSFISVSCTAEGHITGLYAQKTQWVLDRVDHVDYEFTADDGRVYQGSDDLSNSQRWHFGYTKIGNRAIVYYRAGSPCESKLVAQDFVSRIPACVIGGIIGIGFIIYGLIVLKKIKSRKNSDIGIGYQ